MNKLLTLILILFAFIPMIGFTEYTVDCEGYNEETGAYVEGECSDKPLIRKADGLGVLDKAAKRILK